MSAAAQTKIFGIRVGIDPKILIGALIAFAALLFWYNSRGDEETSAPTVARPASATAPITRPHTPVRRTVNTNDRGTLRLRPIDPTRGDVDPTLRLDLLARLQKLQPAAGGRNLFELGPPPLTPAQKAAIANAPKIVPKMPPQPVARTTPIVPTVDIPLKYYGFAKPTDKGQANSGFFLDGDNVIVASEGQLVKQQYLVVELTPTSARLEDVHLKAKQTLPVVPEFMQ